jgi:two-component system phosphate regulon sensor histidine kinase PhoR
MYKTLTRRYLAYLIIIAVTVIVVSLYAGNLTRRIAYRQTVKTLREAASIIMSTLFAEDVEDLDTFSSQVGTDSIRITFIGKDGTVAGDSQADISTLDNHADRVEIQGALKGQEGLSNRYSSSLKQDMVYMALPVFQYRNMSIVLRTSMAVQDIRRELKGIYLRIGLGGIIVLLIISLLTFLIERKMINPIPTLQKAASAYASGELDYYLNIDYPPDLKQVADSLNTMAGSLRQRMIQATSRKNELQAVFSSMIEAVVVLDRELKIRDLNISACRLIKTTLQQARGRSLLAIFRNTDLYAFAERTLSSGAPQEQNITMMIGGELHLQVHGARLSRDKQDGTVDGIVLVLHDMTRLKALEDMRRDFVANVSHELKTPITTIKGYLETLLDGTLKEADTAERFVRIAAKNTDRLNAILDDLLSLSRLEQQNGGLKGVEECSLENIAAGAVQNCLPKATQKKISLKLECGEVFRAEVNPLLIEQALTNLIDNAVKYSETGSSVHITLEHRNEQIALSVKDHGIGIPREDLSRVFERFYRVDKARSRDLGGTGLGLAIVKHIALVHGGRVEAESTPGEGSSFTIILPGPCPSCH